MQELDPTWGRVMSVWWLLAWRTMVGAVLLGGAVVFVFGAITALADWPADKIQSVSAVLGGVIGALWGIVVVSMALKKRFGDFRIALVPISPA
ncbi:MAG: hypothetical protein V3S34_00925 [Hyphomicrobium sp.]